MARFMIMTATSGTNRELADTFAATATEKGHDCEVVDLAEMDLPMFTLARSKDPELVPDTSDLISTMIESDAWIIVAPEYNGSVPPTLNNAIAWMSMDWQNFRTMCTGKPVGLATHSGGGGCLARPRSLLSRCTPLLLVGCLMSNAGVGLTPTPTQTGVCLCVRACEWWRWLWYIMAEWIQHSVTP